MGDAHASHSEAATPQKEKAPRGFFISRRRLNLTSSDKNYNEKLTYINLSKSPHHEIASTDFLFHCFRSVPAAGEPNTAALVPDRNGNRVVSTGLTIIGHRHLKRGVAIDADYMKRIRDILDVCLAIEGRRIRHSHCLGSQGRHRVTFDLIRPAIVPNDCVEITLHAGLCVLDVEPKVVLRANTSRIRPGRIRHHQVAAAVD